MSQAGRSLEKIGLSLILAALLLALIAAVRQTATSQASELVSAPNSEITPTFQPPTESADIALPAIPTPGIAFESGIPRLTNLHTIIPDRPFVDVITYTVQAGDNLFKIAENYKLRPETVLWGNYEVLRDNPQFLRPKQELIILPTDGVYYQWEAGDSLQSIAAFFKVESQTILDYPGNRILSDLTNPEPPKIAAGTWLIIPGGRRDLKDWGPPAITRKNPAAAAYYGSGSCGKVYEGSIGIGTFVWPTVARTLSGYDYSPSLHPGIDIAGPEGNTVFATDSGVVVYAGWSEFGYGYLIVLDHGNGWQSAYAHLSAVSVGCGQSVSQGMAIGAVGNTGNSTGPHLHFELRSEIYGKVNPWDFVSP
jgi:murein DD-endopeptidase MepM/ murein hydrolase activator NlpD